MTPFLKLGFCPPADQPRAFAAAQPKRTHGAATHLGPGACTTGTVWPDRIVVLPPPFDERLGLEGRVKRFAFQQLVSKLAVGRVQDSEAVGEPGNAVDLATAGKVSRSTVCFITMTGVVIPRS